MSSAGGRKKPPTANDLAHMERALVAAKKGLGRTQPNPAVGAVVARGARLIAEGHHVRAGSDHAEIVALRRAKNSAKGATLYSTLEPCNQAGRTGPCTEAILQAGVKRVVIGTLDPNPKVSGRGVRRLRSAGLEVEVGVLEASCKALNEAYNHAIVAGRPFVVWKLATSLDGRIATRTGESQWITSDKARARGRALRARLDSIAVGVETVIADDPRLTARIKGAQGPLRVVFDSQARLPPKSKLVQSAENVATYLVTTRAAPAARLRRLEAAGLKILAMKKTRNGRVDLQAALTALHGEGVLGMLLEGGATLAGAFVEAGLVDKVVAYVAPVLIGGEGAKNALGGRGVGRLSDALRVERVEHTVIGDDMEIVGNPQRPRG